MLKETLPHPDQNAPGGIGAGDLLCVCVGGGALRGHLRSGEISILTDDPGKEEKLPSFPRRRQISDFHFPIDPKTGAAGINPGFSLLGGFNRESLVVFLARQ